MKGVSGGGTTTTPVEGALLHSPSYSFSHQLLVEWAFWMACMISHFSLVRLFATP